MKNFPLVKISKKRKAFSLGEVVLSAFVLTVGLTATTALIASSLNYTYNNRDVVIASQLAQEGIELVRNIRDNNFAVQLDGGSGGSGFQGFDPAKPYCRVDSTNGMTCNASRGNPANQSYYLTTPIDPRLGDRFVSTGQSDRFVRYVYVKYDPVALTAQVVSYVFWDWSNGQAMPVFIPSDGGTSNCNLANKCVFSEVFLTKWGIL